ncbi:hypothetical protein CLV58_101180 [Spirosoma oryzae]|uniref:Uncharacterized protein n=1 Tax=Spirosoma oryzae TaxID=1469603 RepID=A0A2T0TN03_9BACT|nr:hypothetical protein CLV58_101180 [Spirosoma oryzae]
MFVNNYFNFFLKFSFNCYETFYYNAFCFVLSVLL